MTEQTIEVTHDFYDPTSVRDNTFYAIPTNDSDITALETEIKYLNFEIKRVIRKSHGHGLIIFVSKDRPVLKHGKVENPQVFTLNTY